jgi:hypothetical protein
MKIVFLVRAVPEEYGVGKTELSERCMVDT